MFILPLVGSRQIFNFSMTLHHCDQYLLNNSCNSVSDLGSDPQPYLAPSVLLPASLIRFLCVSFVRRRKAASPREVGGVGLG